jgi:cell division protease FtsH
VGGCHEAKEELAEVIRQLANPGLTHSFGAKPIKGVLMTGDPGNGKTILAEGTAGEAQEARTRRMKNEAAKAASAKSKESKRKAKANAQALAEKANVPFYCLAGSDFVEMFVGVGASFAARLQEVQRGSAPILLKVEKSSGHSLHHNSTYWYDMLSFFAHYLGLQMTLE